MFTVNKAIIATAAVIAVGLVAAVDMARSGTETAAATVVARFPAASEMMASIAPVSSETGSCTREHWPYIADECLTGTDGAAVTRPARTIPIERRIVDPAPSMRVATR